MGLFVVLEAIDGSGKTTSLDLLATALRARGVTVALTAYPDRAAPITGALVARFLKGELELCAGDTPPDLRARMLLGQALFALNRRELAGHLEALIASHDIVLASRYQLSGRAYALGAGLEPADLDALFAVESDLRRPDLTLILDIEPATAASRASERAVTDAFERDASLQAGARAAYLAAAESDQHRIIVVPSRGDEVAVGQALLSALDAALSEPPGLSQAVEPQRCE